MHCFLYTRLQLCCSLVRVLAEAQLNRRLKQRTTKNWLHSGRAMALRSEIVFSYHGGSDNKERLRGKKRVVRSFSRSPRGFPERQAVSEKRET